MKAITPNYVNDLADMIANGLERAFPATQFVIQPEISMGPRQRTWGNASEGLNFTIIALLSLEERRRDPHGTQQSPPGIIRLHRNLWPKEEDLYLELAETVIPGLIEDLNRTILNPHI